MTAMNNSAYDAISDIQLEHIGEDYCLYSFKSDEGTRVELEIDGYAQAIINTLGKSLKKESFLKLLK